MVQRSGETPNFYNEIRPDSVLDLGGKQDARMADEIRRGRELLAKELNVTSLVGATRSSKIIKQQLTRIPRVDHAVLEVAS